MSDLILSNKSSQEVDALKQSSGKKFYSIYHEYVALVCSWIGTASIAENSCCIHMSWCPLCIDCKYFNFRSATESFNNI